MHSLILTCLINVFPHADLPNNCKFLFSNYFDDCTPMKFTSEDDGGGWGPDHYLHSRPAFFPALHHEGWPALIVPGLVGRWEVGGGNDVTS